MKEDSKFQDYRNRLNIQDVLIDAGYTLYKRDGLRYPAFVRLDDEGRRIRGDKFLVTPRGNCCFQPPQIKLYSVTSFIWEHPELFQEHHAGMKEGQLVHKVCQRLLNIPEEERKQNILEPRRDSKPFDLNEYETLKFHPKDFESQKPFYAFFKARGIDFNTRCAFHNNYVLASKTMENGSVYKNLSFPMQIPGQPDKCVGLEQRGYPTKEGKSFKGMAPGTNASEGMWIASPRNTKLSDAKLVFVFESAYDAMAFYQMLTSKDSNLDKDDRSKLRSAVYVSTGGNPSYGQMKGLIENAPNATFHLGFDNDMAGKQYVMNFKDIASKCEDREVKVIREEPSEGYKDFNEELLGKDQHSLVDLIETAFDDESGIDLTVEELDEVEENENEKHHGFRR